MPKKRGFSGMMILDRGDSGARGLSRLRRGIQRDMQEALESIDKKEDDEEKAQSNVLKNFAMLDAWQKLAQVQTNATTRLTRLSQYAETTGPNAGKIVVSATWDAKNQAVFAEMLDGNVQRDIDITNGFGAMKGMMLWTILSGDIGFHNLTETLFGGIFFLQFLGQGLSATPMMNGLPGFPSFNNLVLPRLVGAQIAVIAK